MKSTKITPTFYLIFVFLLSNVLPVYGAEGKSAMVVTADARATTAAYEVLRGGGNAVDAAIAAQWVLNVVEPQSSGIGGGGFFVYYEAKTQRFYAFDGREKAPAEAHPEMFLDKDGQIYDFYPERITGGLPVGVPGTLKLLKDVHSRFSSKKYSFGDLFEPAIDLAERGIQISPRLAAHMRDQAARLSLFEASKEIFFDRTESKPLEAGDILIQRDLGMTFRYIQKEGIQIFYEGEIARDIVRAVREAPYHPGLMKWQDLVEYQVVERLPLRGNYRGYDIISMGPPSSGGSTVIEALNILEHYDIALKGHTPDGIHLLSEVQKLAFQDRNRYLGDPDYSKIPIAELISKEFATKRSEEIIDDVAIPTHQPIPHPPILEGRHTSHMSIVDAFGNMVSFTTTIEHVFGSAMVVPGRGFVLNNELTDFDANKEHQNPLHPNAPESDKRPRSSMTPSIVMKDQKPVLIVGTPGGSTIIGTVFNIIVNVLDFQMTLKEAVKAPRVINRNGPIELETDLFQNLELKNSLQRKGHQIKLRPVIGNAQVIYFDPMTSTIHGESDIRGEGKAKGY